MLISMAIFEFRMNRTLHGADFRGGFSGLIMKDIDGVAGVMPQQMIRPAARFAFGIHVRAPEEERLHDEMLQLQLAGLDLLMNPLMTRIEAAGVAAHGDQPGFFLNGENFFGVGQRIGNRNFDFDVFSGAHALDGLFGVDLRRRGQNDSFDAGPGDGFVEIGGPVRNAVFFRDGFCGFGGSAVNADNFDVFDALQGRPDAFWRRRRTQPCRFSLGFLLKQFMSA